MNHHRFLGQLLFPRPQGVTDQEKSKKKKKEKNTGHFSYDADDHHHLSLEDNLCTLCHFFYTIYLNREKKNRLNGTGRMVFYDSLH